jgi:hypothetical protein
MILPIGDNCNVALSLTQLGLRQHSYPFDWVLTDSFDNFAGMLLDILVTDDVEQYAKEFFNYEKNDSYIQPYDQKRIFKNVRYEMKFPHDDYDTILEKYMRRFKRLRDDFYSADKVVLVYITRWEGVDKEMTMLYDKLREMRNDIFIYTINGIHGKLKGEYENKIHVDYFKYAMTLKEVVSNNWDYDRDVYMLNVRDIFKNFFERHPELR